MIRNPAQFEQLLTQVRRFIREECMPYEAAIDQSDEIPESLVQRMRELGLFGHSIPEAFGGAGLTTE
jgi:acyl-CoA dehydrogenase